MAHFSPEFCGAGLSSGQDQLGSLDEKCEVLGPSLLTATQATARPERNCCESCVCSQGNEMRSNYIDIV